MASDGRCQGKPQFEGFALSLSPASVAEADRLFAALAMGDRCKCRWPRRSFRPVSHGG